MQPLRRPVALDDFISEARACQITLEARIAGYVGGSSGTLFDALELWRKPLYNNVMGEARDSERPLRIAKCAYCERIRDIAGELDVEHYRPKGEVSELDGEPPIIPMQDEKPRQLAIAKPGYWWLALEWSNYLLACKTCNTSWKRNLFPVQPGTRASFSTIGEVARWIVGGEAAERPQLLNPYADGYRPMDHFSWTDDGILEPRSGEGRCTIVVCGLNRAGLLQERRDVAIEFMARARKVRNSAREGDLDRRLSALRQLGLKRRPFTAMVRSLFFRYFRREWETVFVEG